jgi:hypothetical protein
MKQCTFDLNGESMSKFKIGTMSFAAFSGLGSYANRRLYSCIPGKGAIPPGTYYIFDRQSGGLLGKFRDLFNDHDKWFALYAIDRKVDDITFCNSVKRGSFRLHPKAGVGISQGCITIERPSDFEFISRILRSVSPIAVPGVSLKAYGKVVVQ